MRCVSKRFHERWLARTRDAGDSLDTAQNAAHRGCWLDRAGHVSARARSITSRNDGGRTAPSRCCITVAPKLDSPSAWLARRSASKKVGAS